MTIHELVPGTDIVKCVFSLPGEKNNKASELDEYLNSEGGHAD